MHDSRPSSPLQVVHDGLGAALGSDLSKLSTNELLDVVADAYRAEARAAAFKARAIAEMDARDAHTVVGAQTAAAYITHRCRVPGGKARHDVLVARSLRHLPETAARLADGDVGEAQASTIARCQRNPRTAEAAERDEALLAKHATSLPYKGFTAVVAYWTQLADPDGTDTDAEERRARRRLHLSRTFDGMWVLDGLLDAVSGAAVDEALHRVTEQLRLEEPDPLERSAAQRRADALVELAHRASATAKRRPKPLVSVLVGYETLAGRICELADGTVVAPSDVSALLDEAVIERVVFDGPDRVMAVGMQRCFTGALRRAIEVRDRTCTHPYCDIRADRCDADHRLPYIEGGPTEQGNGRMGCPFHNRHGRKPRRGPPAVE